MEAPGEPVADPSGDADIDDADTVDADTVDVDDTARDGAAAMPDEDATKPYEGRSADEVDEGPTKPDERRPVDHDATMLDGGRSQDDQPTNPYGGYPADHDATMLDGGRSEDDEPTKPAEGRPVEHDATMLDEGRQVGHGATMLDAEIVPVPPSTYIDRMHGTRADLGVPIVAPTPVPPGPPRTAAFEHHEATDERPHTRVMSESMVGGLFGAPMPERPVEQIAPPPPPAPMPEVIERFGIRFVSGPDDAADLLDGVRRAASSGSRTPALLIVGMPHCGQRRLTRLIARALASAGAGDGSVRTTEAGELRGDQAIEEALRREGPPLLFERLDEAVLGGDEPELIAAAVTRAREGDGGAALIATCEPDAYRRLEKRFPETIGLFEVFRLPDLTDIETRLALVHVLADERRVTIGAAALDTVRADLVRVGGREDLVGARLVEAYLERAIARRTGRAGASHDRLVLAREDFQGVAEEIEPALRPPRDVDGFLRTLGEMIGLEEVKRTVGGLVAEARLAADRAMRGLPSGNPSRNLIFLGRPGTGKMTVAGLVGGVYAALNLLDSGHIVVCDARAFAGGGGAAAVSAQVERANGGVLLIEDAYLLARMPVAQAELTRLMEQRRDKFLIICAGPPDEMDAFLLTDPGFRAGFGAIAEFAEPTDRQLVQLFTRLAERDLYLLDEELRVELLGRFSEMRHSSGFAFAETVRRLFEQTVARQAARLAGGRVDAVAVARLSVRDLPDP